jgi:hypothetical protein
MTMIFVTYMLIFQQLIVVLLLISEQVHYVVSTSSSSTTTCDMRRLHTPCFGPAIDDCGCSSSLDYESASTSSANNSMSISSKSMSMSMMECVHGICVRIPRDYGEPCCAFDWCTTNKPCSEYSISNPSMKLRCSPTCGICISETEVDIRPEAIAAAVVAADEVQVPEIEEEEEEEEAFYNHRCLIDNSNNNNSLESIAAFRTWARTVLTSLPIVTPKSDTELRDVLRIVQQNGCFIRPMGSTHSAPGIVASQKDNDEENNIVIVSLINYTPDDPEWNDIKIIINNNSNNNTSTDNNDDDDDDDDDDAQVRTPAGKTQLELYSIIRPKGYFLPTQTAGWLFTMGGIVANSVHGGHFGKSFLHNYVTSMRVMYSNGTIAILTNEENENDLCMWRSSYGLLGIITSITIQIEKHDTKDQYYKMGIESTRTVQDMDELQAHVERVKNEYIAGQFYYEPITKEVLTIVQQTINIPCINDDDDSSKTTSAITAITLEDEDCEWNYWNAECECVSCSSITTDEDDDSSSSLCSHQYQFGDWTLSTSCRPVNKPIPTNNNECVWDYTTSECRRSASDGKNYCKYRYEAGDISLDDSCRLKNEIPPPPPDTNTIISSYEKLIVDNPLLGLTGVPIGNDDIIQELNCLASRLGLESLIRQQVFKNIKRLVEESYITTNDGFYVTEGVTLPVAYLGYIFPAEYLYAILEEISTTLVGDNKFILTAPIEFRFITIDNNDSSSGNAILTPGNLQNGEYVALEAVSLEIPGWTPNNNNNNKGGGNSWREQFQDIENIIKQYNGAVPHTGKYFGMGIDDDDDDDDSMGETDGLIKPFQNIDKNLIFTSDQKDIFESYRSIVDPNGLFNKGFMAEYLKS